MFLKFSIKSILCFGLLANTLMVSAATDCDVLTDLYKSFEAESKITWKPNTNECCAVKGVTCNKDKIIKIDVQRNGFKGKINDKISTLTDLTSIDLRYNNIIGPIPESISSLTKLEYLNIGENNGLQGRIPKSICSLTKLKALLLYNNLLTSEIPDCIGELSNLEELDLDNNKLNGYVPSSIGNLKNLKLLNLENNQLSGTLPDSFANLDKLENFNVKGNGSLIGYLPEIDNIKSCSYNGTNLCVRENSKVCSNDLRKCTEDDMKKVQDFNRNLNGTKEKKSGGMKGIVIIIIVLLIIAIITGVLLFMRYRKNKNKNVDDVYRSQSKLNILPVSKRESISRSKTEKSFVVLTPKGDVVDKPPQLALDESIFNYVDIKKQSKENVDDSINNSRISTDIKTQEQYEKRLQYENLLQNQSYYLD